MLGHGGGLKLFGVWLMSSRPGAYGPEGFRRAFQRPCSTANARSQRRAGEAVMLPVPLYTDTYLLQAGQYTPHEGY